MQYSGIKVKIYMKGFPTQWSLLLGGGNIPKYSRDSKVFAGFNALSQLVRLYPSEVKHMALPWLALSE